MSNNNEFERRGETHQFMHEMRENLTSTNLKLGLLEKDVANNQINVAKLDENVTALKELNVTMSNLVYKHEVSIDTTVASVKEAARLAETRRVQREDEIKELHTRITHIVTELKDEIHTMKDQLSAEIEKKLAGHSQGDDDIVERIRKLEMWKWMLLGAGAVIGFVLTKLPYIITIGEAIDGTGQV